MNPLTKDELTALLVVPVGNLKPYQVKQLLDALNRRYWDRKGNPEDQQNLAQLVSEWGS